MRSADCLYCRYEVNLRGKELDDGEQGQEKGQEEAEKDGDQEAEREVGLEKEREKKRCFVSSDSGFVPPDIDSPHRQERVSVATRFVCICFVMVFIFFPD
jgi:hypothetical protein